jgi:NAD-dependent dihydropyrimidine dehydrogenase PreA subunit
LEYPPREQELRVKKSSIKSDELENVVCGICADECNDDEVMIPKLEEHAEEVNSDAIDKKSDQSGRDKEIPSMPAASVTSILWI